MFCLKNPPPCGERDSEGFHRPDVPEGDLGVNFGAEDIEGHLERGTHLLTARVCALITFAGIKLSSVSSGTAAKEDR